MLPEEKILQAIAKYRTQLKRPIIVALDGGSGAGKSTISGRLKKISSATIITLDDFYQTTIPESDWGSKTVQERLDLVFEWDRIRTGALEPLRAGKPGRWRAFDFTKGLSKHGTYCLSDEYTEVPPSPIIILEGNFSASLRLRDLIDLSVLVNVPTKERHRRLRKRENDDQFLNSWHQIWDEVEAYYYQQVNPPSRYDLMVNNERLE